jgi:hypothetical protein
MASTYSIAELLREAFDDGTDQPQPFDVDNIATDGGSQFVQMQRSLAAVDALGRPYFLPVRLGGVQLPGEPVVRIRGRKRIVETTLVGSSRRGAVKELIGIDDYDVLIRGVAFQLNNNKDYPEDEVQQLHELYLRPEALKVESGLTALLGIERLVIRDITLPEQRGFQHVQAYELSCRSDEDFILEIDA